MNGQGLFGCLRINSDPKPLAAVVQSFANGTTTPTNEALPTATVAGVELSYSPWAVWVIGQGFELGQYVTVAVDGVALQGASRWGIPLAVSPNGNVATFQLPSNALPGGLNAGQAFDVQLIFWQPATGMFTSPLVVTLPGV